jgi:putative methylase
MLSKKRLAIILSQLEPNLSPDPGLEQYTIPGELASEVINLAFISGDIENRIILDLGCGSGRLTIGTALMGAKKVMGVEIDKNVLETTRQNIKKAEELSGKSIGHKIELINSNIENWEGKADTVIQNPPFGIQKEHADRIFLEKALKSANKIYSLHRHYSKSRKFLTKYAENLGGKVEIIKKYKFRIPHMFKFHQKPAVSFDVDLYVIGKAP